MKEHLTLTSTQVSGIIEGALPLKMADGMWGDPNDFSATAVTDRRGSYVAVRSYPDSLDEISAVLAGWGYVVGRESGEDTKRERVGYGMEAVTTVPYDRLIVTLAEGA